MEFFMDGSVLNVFDTSIGHYIIAAAVILAMLGWSLSLSTPGTGVRKLAAVAFGGSVALAAFVLLAHFFPPGPISPGAMP